MPKIKRLYAWDLEKYELDEQLQRMQRGAWKERDWRWILYFGFLGLYWLATTFGIASGDEEPLVFATWLVCILLVENSADAKYNHRTVLLELQALRRDLANARAQLSKIESRTGGISSDDDEHLI